MKISEFLNSRLSFGLRLGLIAGSAAPPIALLFYLFAGHVFQDAAFINLELDGAAYSAEIWPALLAASNDAPGPPAPTPGERERKFRSLAEAKAFAAAEGPAKADAGVALMRAVADGSNLTLDNNLASYYAMDAATQKLPRLGAALAAVSDTPDLNERTFVLGRVEGLANAAIRDMNDAMDNDPTGRVRVALAPHVARLRAAFEAFKANPARGNSPPRLALMQALDETWRVDNAQVVRMLQARKHALQLQLLLNLGLVSLALGVPGLLMVFTAQGLNRRVRGLLAAVDALNVNNTDIEVPYLTYRNETGRIALALESFRRRLVEAAEERRRIAAAEAALREVNAELRRVARASALGAFATSLAHEIKQPLAAVVTNAEVSLRWLDQEPRDPERAIQALNRAARDARRACDIIDRMRGMVTRQDPVEIDFDLNDALRDIMMLTQTEQGHAAVSTSTDLAPGLPFLRGDRIHLQQVMLNLVLNAIDAMRDTPAQERRLLVRSWLAAPGEIRIAVEDSGTGIAPDAVDRIFEHLFTTKTGGTGLGLAISKSIVESHGGRIWAEPARERGAVFTFTLPFDPSRTAAVADQP